MPKIRLEHIVLYTETNKCMVPTQWHKTEEMQESKDGEQPAERKKKKGGGGGVGAGKGSG